MLKADRVSGIIAAIIPGIHNQAAIANCDGKDGLVDGQITEPRVCTFKPESLRCSFDREQANCLTTAQIAVANKIYGGVVDPQGRLLYPGSQTIGSELGWAGPLHRHI